MGRIHEWHKTTSFPLKPITPQGCRDWCLSGGWTSRGAEPWWFPDPLRRKGAQNSTSTVITPRTQMTPNFWRPTPQNKAFSNQNRGRLGSIGAHNSTCRDEITSVTSVTHSVSAIYRGLITLFITGDGAHLVWIQAGKILKYSDRSMFDMFLQFFHTNFSTRTAFEMTNQFILPTNGFT